MDAPGRFKYATSRSATSPPTQPAQRQRPSPQHPARRQRHKRRSKHHPQSQTHPLRQRRPRRTRQHPANPQPDHQQRQQKRRHPQHLQHAVSEVRPHHPYSSLCASLTPAPPPNRIERGIARRIAYQRQNHQPRCHQHDQPQNLVHAAVARRRGHCSKWLHHFACLVKGTASAVPPQP